MAFSFTKHHCPLIWYNCLSIFLLLVVGVSHLSAASDVTIPDKISSYVNDWGQLMTTNQARQLDQQLRQFEQQTSNQLVVATFPSLEGENIEETSIRMFEKWHIGQKNKDNGILLTVWKAERKIRIEVGYGLEPVLTDALSARIIRDEMAPAFRQGDYYGGIVQGVRAVVAVTQGAYTGNGRSKGNRKQDGGGIAGLIIPLLFFFLLFSRRRGALGGFLLGSVLGSAMRGGGFGGFSGGGGFGGGGGASGGW